MALHTAHLLVSRLEEEWNIGNNEKGNPNLNKHVLYVCLCWAVSVWTAELDRQADTHMGLSLITASMSQELCFNDPPVENKKASQKNITE